jgi:hypothetical protein
MGNGAGVNLTTGDNIIDIANTIRIGTVRTQTDA